MNSNSCKLQVSEVSKLGLNSVCCMMYPLSDLGNTMRRSIIFSMLRIRGKSIMPDGTIRYWLLYSSVAYCESCYPPLNGPLSLEQGIPREDIYCISAATNAGVLELVRATRRRLDSMPATPMVLETDAANVQEAPSRRPSEARISEFTIESDFTTGPRLWFVEVRSTVLP